ncbi:PilZ domain-containing protein [Pseudocolwellia sp. HL-MZ19]|uniref:PilZ domain-containing protein n=1 Tax=unclassified Pseudocolwellia TaxID=2848178 RepID=UPI003CFB0520
MSNAMENRRTFTRILFSLDAKLTIDEIEQPVSLHDISISGALIKCSAVNSPQANQTGVLQFALDDNSQITMKVTVVHVHNQEENIEIGLDCNAIDLDSISILRRLIELNLGDSKQLNKELSELSYLHE